MIYKMLTAAIIVLAEIRQRFSSDMQFRFDRTLPWPKDQPNWGLWMKCCDCGLSHFFICGQSGTPVRPGTYDYGMRFGITGHTDPDHAEGHHANATIDSFFDQYDRNAAKTAQEKR